MKWPRAGVASHASSVPPRTLIFLCVGCLTYSQDLTRRYSLDCVAWNTQVKHLSGIGIKSSSSSLPSSIDWSSSNKTPSSFIAPRQSKELFCHHDQRLARCQCLARCHCCYCSLQFKCHDSSGWDSIPHDLAHRHGEWWSGLKYPGMASPNL